MTIETGALSSGRLTFLFSDIEGSTVRWERDRMAMASAMQRHDALMGAAIAEHQGHVFKTVGDAFYAVFEDPARAVDAAIYGQRCIAAEDFSAVDGLRVRMALHSGTADERNGDYFGPALNRVARILAIVYGGQIVLSDGTSDLVRDRLPPDTSLLDLGAHRLKDLAQPERLYQLIAADLRRDFPVLRSLEQLPNNLPLQLTHLIGRDEELATTKALIKESRLVTLVGAGGIGKTRLALQAGAELLDDFDDGAWFIDLAPVRDPQDVALAVASALGVKESSERPIIESLVGAMRRKRLLLILDNCEHLITVAAQLSSALLQQCADLQIMATSRQPLGVSGERVHRVSSLTLPPDVASSSRDDALQYSAVALFVDRARAATESFELADGNAIAVATICRRLDGIPLAIELAAARLKTLSLDEVGNRLSQRFRVLTGGSRDALPRQQTMHALIDWSYDLLDEDEKRLFRGLCVFSGSFSLEATAAVSADETTDDWRSLELLSSLVDKSLVISEPFSSVQRYRLLESMRAYGLEKASACGEVQAIRLRHAEYYTALAEKAEATRESTLSLTDWAQALEADLANFRAALDWTLVTPAQVELGAGLLTTLDKFWRARGLVAETARRAEQFLNLAVNFPELLQADLWQTLAGSLNDLLISDRQLEAATRACDLYEKVGSRSRLASALRTRGGAQMRLADFVAAEKDQQQALMIFREIGDQLGIAKMLLEIAYRFILTDRFAEAAAQLRDVLKIYHDLGDNSNIATVQLNLAEVEFALGDVRTAVERAKDNLESPDMRIDAVFRSQQEHNLAAYFLALGQTDEAHVMAVRALSSAQRADHKVYCAIALQHLMAVLAARDPRLAARTLGYIERSFATTNFQRQFTERFTYERLMETLRGVLTDEEVASLTHEGSLMSSKQVFGLVHAPVDFEKPDAVRAAPQPGPS